MTKEIQNPNDETTRSLPFRHLGFVIRHSFVILVSSFVIPAAAAEPLKPIPDRLVVLTFDDGNKSDIEVVAPLLKKYNFGATFFITEGLGAEKDKKNFLTWEEVQQLDRMGFEIGNHTRRHINVTKQPRDQVDADAAYIEDQCQKLGIAKPVSFCYPGYRHNLQAVEVLQKRGYKFARRGYEPELKQELEGGRGLAYDPKVDHPLLIPTTGAAGPKFALDDLTWALDQARDGKICVLTFHGVPARLHPWVHVAPADLERYLRYLKQRVCTVIALRDLARYVDPSKANADPYAGINTRLKKLEPEPPKLKDPQGRHSISPKGIDRLARGQPMRVPRALGATPGPLGRMMGYHEVVTSLPHLT